MITQAPAERPWRWRLRAAIVAAGLAAHGLAAWLQADVLLNEIHYNPDVKTEPVEFVELFNAGPSTANLTGWRLTDGIEFTFPNAALPPGGYLVVAANPAALQAKFGVVAIGPFTGGLSKYGDRIVLLDEAGNRVDAVEYQPGFPWPTVGDPPGYSIELIHPSLDNELGGSWRASVAGGGGQPQDRVLVPAGAAWQYVPGTQEASAPVSAWREPDFPDAGWSAGNLPIGYDPGMPLATPLADMRYGYTSVFLRRTFEVEDPASVTSLLLDALYDDGFKLWINGTNLLNVNISTAEVAFDGTAGPARESNEFETFALDNPARFLKPGVNVLAVQLHNSSRDASSDCFFDCQLASQTGPTGRGPTPGRVNAAYALNAPPQARQVEHTPKSPRGGEPVRITAKVTDPDGVAEVQLLYQIVEPGQYLELTDPAYETQWLTQAMRDDAQGGDAVAGDFVFTAELPGTIQAHRRLIRYRLTVRDTQGASVRLPYADDPQPNFAYFVYDGVPAWTGAVRPGNPGPLGQALAVGTAEMNRLPVIHLIGRRSTVEESTWFSRYGGDAYPWLGTLVHEGRVYDHIHHRARGGVWRYSMVKNMWKFDFNRGHDFEARDNWGRKFDTAWTKLNLGASIQQGDFNHRGEQGLFESVGFRLFQLAGVPAPHSTFCQFRVVDDALEVDPASQYDGDFWGVYLMIEQEDGRFLEEHDLADANFYKMEGGTGELNNLGPLGPVDKSDLGDFLNVVNQNAPADEAWFRSHLDLPAYYSYQAVAQAIHHYDICYDKNFFYYFHPTNRSVSVTPWDLDLTWAENMYDAGCGGADRIKTRMLTGPARYPALWREWQNRIREVRDLLWNEDEAWRLIDEYAGRLRGPINAPSLVDADRAQWDYNPKMNNATYTPNLGKAGQGRFYKWPNEPTVSKDFQGGVQLMKHYVTFRSSNPSAQARALDLLANDPSLPATPAATYDGPPGYPANAVRLRCSAYQGAASFAALQWRIGEITRPTLPSWQSSDPWKYEIEPVWQSPLITTFVQEAAIPPGVLKPGHTYRARVRFHDADGRASHWSAPVEFVAGEPDQWVELQRSLRVTEVMYHPPAGNAFEFIELHNASPDSALRLDGAAFTQGIDYVFPAGVSLAPGGCLLVVKGEAAGDFAAFRAHYGLGSAPALYGPYGGSLNDGGEQVTLKAAAGGTNLVSFTYHDRRNWPLAADGAGHSLVPRRDFGAAATGMLDFGGNWRASAFLKGSPGRADPEPGDVVVLNEIVTHTDFTGEFDSNDWIELFNRATTNVTLGPAWYLSDEADNLRKWQIPAATQIAGRGYVSFDEVTGFHNPANTGFGLDKAGEQVFLSHLPGGATDRVVDAFHFAGQENEWTFTRSPDGGAYWDYVEPRSRNGANGLTPYRVVISEFLYHTGFETNLADPTILEFVEVFNPANAPAPLFNTNGVWRLGGGVEFAFPSSTVVAPGERIVVVPFAPAEATAATAFRQAYGVPASVRLFGPSIGRLDNDTDRITLERPLAPDLPGEPTVAVVADEVIYFDREPWPGGADGEGASYNRRLPEHPGNDPAHWYAAAPSPGSAPTGPVDDADADGMPTAWEQANDLDPFDSADAFEDPDHDGIINLEEYRSGTDPHEHSLRLVVTAMPGFLEFRYLAPPGRQSGLEFAETLEATDWTLDWLTIFYGPSPAQERTLTLPASAGEGQRFYRVRVQ